MHNIRIIPRLDIKGPNLVKGIQLEGLRVLGKPEDFAHYYYQNGADELFYQDVVASLYGKNSIGDFISKTAKQIFIPLTVGGGIRSESDIRNALKAGADKVSINTAALKNPEFIRKASQVFGSSTIVVAIEAIKQGDGRYLAFIDNGREYTGVDAVLWAKQAEELGAGEIVITSVDRDGTGLGFDLTLVSEIVKNVSIPVVAHGGASDLDNIEDVIIKGKADGVALSSMLHYGIIKNMNKLSIDHDEGNTEFLRSGKIFSKIQTNTIMDIKYYLNQKSIMVRL